MLMSVYNTDFLLVKRAIDSVLNQDFQDFELIVIDDGSNSDNDNRLLQYVTQHSDRVTYLYHSNCGQSKSINRGILNSRGKYIAILDSDDEYKTNHLRLCTEQMPFADLIASTTTTIVDKEEDYYVPDKFNPNQLIHVDDCILFATLFGKREVFADMKFLDIYGADAHFFEKAAKKFSVQKIDLRTYIYYRNNPNSICSSLKRKNLPELV